MLAFQSKDDGAASTVAPTLRAMGYDGSHANGGGQLAVCVTGKVTHSLTSQGADASEDGTGRGTPIVMQCHGSNVGPIGTLRKGNGNTTGGVPFMFQPRIARSGRGQPKEIVDSLSSSNSGIHGDSKPHVSDGQTLRRLTPRECERLMGWPDDHTKYMADGTEIKDGPRYEMIGNGVVKPVAKWLGSRVLRYGK